MARTCGCTLIHHPKRVVLTGGPGARKTAVLEMLAHEICSHVIVTKEAAGILFAAGFPRGMDPHRRAATQRSIHHVQRAIETIAAESKAAMILHDRGVVDGSGDRRAHPGGLGRACPPVRHRCDGGLHHEGRAGLVDHPG